jgi:hypothetical protein
MMRVPIWVLAVHDCEVAQVDGFKSRDLVIDLGQPSPESVAPLRGEPMTGDQLVDDAGGRGLSNVGTYQTLGAALSACEGRLNWAPPVRR